MIRKVVVEDKFTAIAEPKQEIIIQKKIALYSKKFLEENYGEEQNEHLKNLIARLHFDLNFFERELAETNDISDNSLRNYQKIYLEMLDHQRKLLDKMNQHTEFDEDLIRKYLGLIDVEEYKIREKLLQEIDSE